MKVSPTRRDPKPFGSVKATASNTDAQANDTTPHDKPYPVSTPATDTEQYDTEQYDTEQYDTEQYDLVGAKHYALNRLEQQLPERFVYHSLEHTRDNVYPTAMRIAELEGISGRALCLLRTATYFHDLGFSEAPHTSQDHEIRGSAIAQQILPAFGYSDDDIRLIQGMILATKLPQTPKTLLEHIIADADLSVLGQRDFLKQNRALRAELESGGMNTDDQRWLTGQYNFLSGHRYFTRAARQLLSAQKAVNLASLRTLIGELPQAS